MAKSKLNWMWILTGGLLAGVVMNAVDFVVNAWWLAPQWTAATQALGVSHAATRASAGLGWVVVDFVTGLGVVWTYSAFRPRFGAGPWTAFWAALTVWTLRSLTLASYVFMGLFPVQLVASVALGGIVATVCAAELSCWLYKEA